MEDKIISLDDPHVESEEDLVKYGTGMMVEVLAAMPNLGVCMQVLTNATATIVGGPYYGKTGLPKKVQKEFFDDLHEHLMNYINGESELEVVVATRTSDENEVVDDKEVM